MRRTAPVRLNCRDGRCDVAPLHMRHAKAAMRKSARGESMRAVGSGRKRRCHSPEPPDTDDDENDGSRVEHVGSRVFFYSNVTRSAVLQLVTHLDAAAAWALDHCETPARARVHLYIHSGGGDVYAGLSAMDHIRTCRVPVTTVADDFVASAATFMLLGGQTRVGMVNTNILIHQLSADFWGKWSELEFEMINTRKLMQQMKTLYAKHTQLTPDQLDHMLSGELVLTAEEAITYGFIAEII